MLVFCQVLLLSMLVTGAETDLFVGVRLSLQLGAVEPERADERGRAGTYHNIALAHRYGHLGVVVAAHIVLDSKHLWGHIKIFAAQNVGNSIHRLTVYRVKRLKYIRVR